MLLKGKRQNLFRNFGGDPHQVSPSDEVRSPDFSSFILFESLSPFEFHFFAFGFDLVEFIGAQWLVRIDR